MIRNFQYKDWLIEFDREATIDVYKNIETGNAERCSCCYCKNFITARDSVYPTDFLAFLKNAGADYKKDSEVFQIYRIQPGLHRYGGWFHFVGKLRNTSIAEENELPQFTHGDFEYVLAPVSAPVSEQFKEYMDKKTVVEIEFHANVPWLIDHPEFG